ncbi:MAG: pilus assembly protein TadG-related protein, partial [Rhodospirillaceae bacterium]
MLSGDSGSVTTAVAIVMPGLMFGAAMVVDMMLLNAHRSHVQAQADFAALEAVRFVSDEDTAFSQALVSVSLNDRFPARPLHRPGFAVGRY